VATTDSGQSDTEPTKLGVTDLPGDTASADNPTGMFAGEREGDHREEQAVRRVLERAIPGDPGRWKESGADPGPVPDR